MPKGSKQSSGRALARALVQDEVALRRGASDEDVVGAYDVLFGRIASRLGRTIGAGGVAAVLGRAVQLAREGNHAAAAVSVGPDGLELGRLRGLESPARGVELEAVLFEVLGRVTETVCLLVGADLALGMLQDLSKEPSRGRR